MIAIKVLLTFAALYGAGMWAFTVYIAYSRPLTDQTRRDLEANSFHLGICAITAAGFLGLLLK